MGSDGHRAGSELFVCFPSRTSMSLMPKPILSPGRSLEGAKRVRNNGGRGQSSPMFSIPLPTKKNNSKYQVEEPTSPKVTCAGQVRVKPSKQCKSWQSVMAEIEKLHSHKHRKRGSASGPATQPVQHRVVGLKREVVQFVTALRNLRVDFGCFGAPAVSTDEEDEEEDEEEEEEAEAEAEAEGEGVESKEPMTSGTVFAKWFMMLQDNDDRKVKEMEGIRRREEDGQKSAGDWNETAAVPPPNALLLMRCRSAPSGASLNTRIKAAEEENAEAQSQGKRCVAAAVVLRRCDPDFSGMLSMDVSEETWVNRRDFIKHSFLRSVSLKG